jgi:hypothetical protein
MTSQTGVFWKLEEVERVRDTEVTRKRRSSEYMEAKPCCENYKMQVA